MSLQLKFVAGLAVIATVGLITESAQAQLFRSNNCACQPVVVQPACPVYYTGAQPAFAAPVYSAPEVAVPMAVTPMEVVPMESGFETVIPFQSEIATQSGISSEGFDLAPGETLVSVSPVEAQAAAESIVNTDAVVNGVLEPQYTETIQPSVSDIPASGSVEPVPAADTTIISPVATPAEKPSEEKPAAVEKAVVPVPAADAPATKETPAKAEPTKTEPVAAEPAKTEPAEAAKPVATEPAKADEATKTGDKSVLNSGT